MYRTEAEFKQALRIRLQKEHIMVTCIESHGTGNGIPDLFVCGRGLDTWLELKADDRLSINDKVIKVDWRPGQIAWMYLYFQKQVIKSCLTIVRASDGIIIIPMINTFDGHKVYNPEGISFEDLKKIKFSRVLEAMSSFWFDRKNQSAETTYLDLINSFVDEFYPGIDYDPECLWNPDLLDKTADLKVFNGGKLNMILTLEATILNSKEKEDG